MAILDYEGFGEETNLLLSNWFNDPRNYIVSGDGGGPYGIGRYYQNSTFEMGRNNWFPNTSELWFNCHVKMLQYNVLIVGLRDNTTNQVHLFIDASGRLQIRRGDGTILGTSTKVLAQNAWWFVQWRVLIANSGGTAEIWVENEQWLSVSGVDTQNSGAAQANGWMVGGATGASLNLSNVVIYSTAGNAPTSRTPETICYSDLPTGAGATTNWTPSAGANWQTQDEAPNDGDTTYNSAATAIDDLYAYPASPVPASSIVYAVCCEADVRKDDAGTNTVDLLCRGGTTTAPSGTTYNLSNTWTRIRRIFDSDPSTAGAWTVANANASQVGIRRTA